ncbi:uncharacterized protein LOC126797485 [Argentina anserina]|uniref:uncharacterized protein LOC126797485 n=1 Tax=Argentina anserina TaxID=57926 RepID=UPI0021762AE4|nr:uncharacterized protein LOC126797485 [Potentilla anserina]
MDNKSVVSQQPRRQRPSGRMRFFEQHLFDGSNGVVPIEASTVAPNLLNDAVDMTDATSQHASGNIELSEGTIVNENGFNYDTSRGSERMKYFQEHLFQEGDHATTFPGEVCTRTRSQKRKFERGEASCANQRNVLGQEPNDEVMAVIIEDNAVNDGSSHMNSSGQAFYKKKRGDVLTDYNDSGDDGYKCVHCDANFWLGEANKRKSRRAPIVYTECCQKGRVKLEKSKPTPDLLEQYLNPDNGRDSVRFRQNIRLYNSMFAYTSMGAKIDYGINNGCAPYVFKICGQVHHLIGSMLPQCGEAPKYAQLYIYDTCNEVSNRMNAIDPSHTSKIELNIVVALIEMFDRLSELTKTYRAIRDRFQSDSLPSLNMTILAPQSRDNKQYERPTNDEIGGLVVGDIGEFDSNKDIIVQSTDGNLRRISKIHPKYMSLQYPILYPYGEDGFDINLLLEPVVGKEDKEPDKMSMRSFITYYLHDRNNSMNTVLKGGRLFQQFLVDAYATVDENRLDYIRQNQDKFRIAKCDEIYTNISFGVENSSDIGRVILPSSHTGCPRDMKLLDILISIRDINKKIDLI